MKLKSLLQENVQLDNVNSLDQLKGITDAVDVVGYVNLANKKLTSLTVKFEKVGGNFYCHNNHLTSLEGCPTKVGGDFYCHSNRLTSLEGCPSEVNGNFYCHSNRLTSLVGVHKSIKKIDGNIYINDNPINEGGIGLLLIDGLKEISVFADQPALKIVNKYLSQGKMGILACQEELIENGYEDFAKL